MYDSDMQYFVATSGWSWVSAERATAYTHAEAKRQVKILNATCKEVAAGNSPYFVSRCIDKACQ